MLLRAFLYYLLFVLLVTLLLNLILNRHTHVLVFDVVDLRLLHDSVHVLLAFFQELVATLLVNLVKRRGSAQSLLFLLSWVG